MKTTINVFYCNESKTLVYRTKEGCWYQFLEDLIYYPYPYGSFRNCSNYRGEENLIIIKGEKDFTHKKLFSFECILETFSLFEKEVIQKTLKKILENTPEILL